MKLTFLGAAKTVTGSKYLLETGGKKYLIDCGLFQGYKELRLRNWDKFPVEPSSIDAVILTHAHIDHTGYLPRLVKLGFNGKIYSTPATHELCKILLMDCAYIQEEDAKRANHYHYSKHHPAYPLYTKKEAQKALQHFKVVNFNTPFTLNNKLTFTYSHAGHVLGAAFITVNDGEQTIVFSGDLGRIHDPLLKSPVNPEKTDYLVCESTYGDRLHKNENPMDEIKEVILSTCAKGGSILIPAFAVGRAQSLLYYLYLLKQAKSIPDIPIYVDSKMATSATEMFCNYKGELRVSDDVCHRFCDGATYVREVEDSKKLNRVAFPSIIISASGMATGGRVLHHLKHILPNPNNTVLLSGFQAGGTRGDSLASGDKEIKIHGEMVQVKARIENLSNVSAHGDYSEILQWLGTFPSAPKKVFLTHGEPESAESLKVKIVEKFGWDTTVPDHLQTETLAP